MQHFNHFMFLMIHASLELNKLYLILLAFVSSLVLPVTLYLMEYLNFNEKLAARQ